MNLIDTIGLHTVAKLESLNPIQKGLKNNFRQYIEKEAGFFKAILFTLAMGIIYRILMEFLT